MDINCYNLDLNRSRDILSKFRSSISLKQCYMNVFNTLMYFPEEERDKVNICYGYVDAKIKSSNPCLVRHAFFLIDNKVIDPTILLTSNKNKEKVEYYIFKKYNLKDYIYVISKNDGYVSLTNHLLNEEIEMLNYLLLEKNAELNQFEILDLFKLYYGEDVNVLMDAVNQFNELNQILPLKK